MPTSLSLGDLTIQGFSRAGEETWFRIHPPGLAFDVGRGATQLAGIADLFLSHGHLDHALGVPFVLSLRSLYQRRATRVHCPAALADGLSDLIRAAESLEAANYKYEINPLEAGDRVPMDKDLSVEAFATDHLVPSLGYHLVRARRRLASRFRGYSGSELVGLKQRGVEIDVTEDVLWLSYCGDTGPAVFELEPRLYRSSILLLECTFFGPDSRERAARFKHIHLEDVIERADRFQNRELILHHPSLRYGAGEVTAEIERHLAGIRPRVHLIGSDRDQVPRREGGGARSPDP